MIKVINVTFEKTKEITNKSKTFSKKFLRKKAIKTSILDSEIILSSMLNISREILLISDNKVYIPKRPGEPDRSLADISNINSELNWQPKISIDEGIKMLMKKIYTKR